MIEYDFVIALENPQQKSGMTEINFPNSCVLYLRDGIYVGGRNIPAKLSVRVNFPEGKYIIYKVPVLRVQDYTKEEIFQKRLLMFIPYYIMRYENQLGSIEEEHDRLNELSIEYENIRKRLQHEMSEAEEREIYTRLAELTVKISDYVLRKSAKARERISGIMGGNILDLETDRIIELGRREGLEKGLTQGACETAELMLIDKEPLEKIVRYARLPIETILQIKESLAAAGKL